MTVVCDLIHSWRDINFTSAQTSDTDRKTADREAFTHRHTLTYRGLHKDTPPPPHTRANAYTQHLHTHNTYIHTKACMHMEWSGRTGHRQRSQSTMETTAGGGGNQVLLYSSRQFSAHPKSSLTRIDQRGALAAGNTRYRYNQIGPPDHKMADNSVSLARTKTVSFLYNN